MSYSNITVVTSQGTYGYSVGATTFNPILYNTLDLIPGIPHNAQLEVERIFSIDRNGVTATIPNFLNDTNVSVVDKQSVFIIPSDRITFDTTGNRITNINLPASGADVYNFSYIPISGPNAGVAQTIAVPQLREGDNIIVRRKTVSNTSLVLWTPGSKLTTAQLNLNTTQLLFLIQEILNKVTIVSVSTEQILDNAITSSKILNKAVTFAKLQDLSGPLKLLGSGSDPINFRDVREMSVGPGFDVTGNTIDVKPLPAGQRNDIEVVSPLTDWRINPNTVTYSKMQDVSAASRLIGRGSAAGSGDPQELTIGGSLSMVGTQLNVTTPLTDGNKGDLTVGSNGTTFTINAGAVITADLADHAVTYAKMQRSLTGNRVLGTTTADSHISEVQINADMIATAAVTNAKLATGSVGSTNLQASAVTTSAINNNAVTYDKLQTVVTANRVLGSTAANGTVSEVQVNTNMVADNAVSFPKMQQIPSNTLLGRATAGTGNVETIAITAAGRDLIDENSVADMRQYLQLGTAALEAVAFFAPAVHSHGSINSAGQIGTTPNLPLITGSNGLISTGTFGTTVSTFCQGNDARLSDARNPLPHTHPISDVINLSNSLASKSDVGHQHIIGDVANLQVSLDNKAPISHIHTIGQITDLQTTLNNKSNVGHGHIISDVEGLQTALNNKANTVHGHVITDVDGLDAALASKVDDTQISSLGLTLVGNTTAASMRNTLELQSAALRADTYFALASHNHTIGEVNGLQDALNAKLDDTQATTYGLSILSGANASAVRNTLGLESAALRTDTYFALAAHNHTLANITDAGSAASRNVPAAGVNATTTQVVMGDDTRLTNARTPTAHTHTLANITDAGTVASRNIPVTGNASSTEVVLGNDTRLSDARTPVAHTHSTADITSGTLNIARIPTGTTSSTVCIGNDSRLSDARTPIAHTHTLSEITDAGTAASKFVPNVGVNATTTQVVMGDDTRLTNARTPVAHTHLISEVDGLQTVLDGKAVTGHTHSTTDITSGTLSVARGGTGVSATPTAGQILIGNNTGFTLANILPGENIAINNTPGGITISTTAEPVAPDLVLQSGTYGDINVSGNTWTVVNNAIGNSKIANDAVTFGKIQNINTNTVLGRATAGTGDVEEITVTAAGRALLDDADAAAQRTTLGAAAASHTHAASDVTSGSFDIARIPTGNTASTVCIGNDARLSDARTPTSHAHGNITNAGFLGTTANIPLITGTGGIIQAGSFGTAANTFCQGNDSRLSDARTPVAHTHLISAIDGLQDALNNKVDDSQITSFGLGLVGAASAGAAQNVLGLGTASTRNISSLGDAASNEVVLGNDTRLTNARTPVAHTHTITEIINLDTTLTNKLNSNLVSSFALTVLDDTTAEQARTTLGVGTAGTKAENYFALASHQHVINDIAGLQTALNNKVDDSDISTFALTLLNDTDAASMQATLGLGTAATQASSAFAAASHTHTIGAIDNLQNTLNAKADATHSHIIGNITGLQDALNAKTDVGHTHTTANIIGLDTTLTNKLNTSAVSSFMLGVIDKNTAATAQTALGLGSAATQPSTAFASASHTHSTAGYDNNSVTYAKIQKVATANRLLGSTTANADVAEVQVATDMVANLAITAGKLADSAVETAKINNLAVTSAKLADGAVSSDKLANGVVTYSKMQTVTTANRVLGSTVAGGVVSEVQINASMLADGLVTTAKIADGNVTAAKLASGAAVANIGNGNITTALLADANVTTAKIANLAITTGLLANNAVTYGKMQAVATANRLLGSTTAGGAVSEVQVTTDMVVDSAITADKLATNAVTNTKIASNAVTTAKIADNNVTLAKLPLSTTANRVLGAATLGSAYTEVQIQTDMIADGAVTAAKLGAISIGNSQLLDDAVSTSKIVNLSVTGAKLADNAVTDAKLRTGAATSVIGRSANTVGNVADIVASVDGQVLHRTGGTLQFGTLGTGSISDGAITTAKIANIAANRVLGTTSGTVEAVQVSTNMIADGAVTAAKTNLKVKEVFVVFSTVGSGSWTVPANVSTIEVCLFGGGGGGCAGGGINNPLGQNGGFGGAGSATLIVTPNTTYSYTIGNGGTGSNGGAGTAGGNTTMFGATSTGGAGGNGSGTFTTYADSGTFTVGSQPSGVSLINSTNKFSPKLRALLDGGLGAISSSYGSGTTSPLAWSYSSDFRPGASGGGESSSQANNARGGGAGAILIWYQVVE
jgi:hypothetical protein